MKIVAGKRLPTVTKTAIKGFFGEYRFLSNFHLCDVKVGGIVYPPSEHAYMALKTTDKKVRRQIRDLTSPVDAKKFGRTIELRPNWDSLRLVAMRKVVLAKFWQNKDLGLTLMAQVCLLFEAITSTPLRF